MKLSPGGEWYDRHFNPDDLCAALPARMKYRRLIKVAVFVGLMIGAAAFGYYGAQAVWWLCT